MKQVNFVVVEQLLRRTAVVFAWILLGGTSLFATDTFTTIYNFPQRQEGRYVGANPALIQSSDGNLYGTTFGEYSGNDSYGTVFRLTPDGTVTTLHSFTGPDGASPAAALVEGKDGAFYGTTCRGGSAYKGTIFRLDPDGTLTTLHNFNGTDGESPTTALIQGTDGNFYGVTTYGGASNAGTLYRMAPNGTVTTLHSFADDDNNGARPFLPLVQGRDGNLYGSVYYNFQYGLVYRMTLDGVFSVFYRFTDSKQGTGAGLLLVGMDGNLYSGSYYGGGSDVAGGTVFRLALDGTLTTLHVFEESPEGFRPDGSNPNSGLIQDRDGNLYGVTAQGYENDGTNFGGTLFRLAPDGTLTTLHKFHDISGDGNGVLSTLLLAGDGLLYGLTGFGGTEDNGTIFRVTRDSVAPVIPVPPVSTKPTVFIAVVNGRDEIMDTEHSGFQLFIDKAQTEDFKIAYRLAGTARPGVDYLAVSGVAKFKAGKQYKNINIIPLAIPETLDHKTIRFVKLKVLKSESYDLPPPQPFKIKIIHP